MSTCWSRILSRKRFQLVERCQWIPPKFKKSNLKATLTKKGSKAQDKMLSLILQTTILTMDLHKNKYRNPRKIQTRKKSHNISKILISLPSLSKILKSKIFWFMKRQIDKKSIVSHFLCRRNINNGGSSISGNLNNHWASIIATIMGTCYQRSLSNWPSIRLHHRSK